MDEVGGRVLSAAQGAPVHEQLPDVARVEQSTDQQKCGADEHDQHGVPPTISADECRGEREDAKSDQGFTVPMALDPLPPASLLRHARVRAPCVEYDADAEQSDDDTDDQRKGFDAHDVERLRTNRSDELARPLYSYLP